MCSWAFAITVSAWGNIYVPATLAGVEIRRGKCKLVVEELGRQVESEVEVPNVFAHDIEHWAKWILERARERIGHLYPPGKDYRPVEDTDLAAFRQAAGIEVERSGELKE